MTTTNIVNAKELPALIEELIDELESLRSLGILVLNLHTLKIIKEILAAAYLDRASLLYYIHKTERVQSLSNKRNKLQTILDITLNFFFTTTTSNYHKHDQTLLQIMSKPHSKQDILNLYSLQAPTSNSPTPDSTHHTHAHPNLCTTCTYMHPKRTSNNVLGGTGK